MHHVTTALTIAAALALAPATVHAQSTLYKVVDQYGNVTYQDTPPNDDTGVRTESLEVEAPAPEPTPAVPAGNRDNVLAAAQTRPLVLFTVPNCDTCDFLRWFLDERELPYEEVDVRTDRDNQERLRDATGEFRVPVLMVGEAPMFGYDRTALTAELTDAGYLAPEASPAGQTASTEPTEPAADTGDAAPEAESSQAQ